MSLDLVAGALGAIVGAGSTYQKFLDEQRQFEMQQQMEKIKIKREEHLAKLRARLNKETYRANKQVDVQAAKELDQFQNDPNRVAQKAYNDNLVADIKDQRKIAKIRQYLMESGQVDNEEDATAIATGINLGLIHINKKDNMKDKVDLLKAAMQATPDVTSMPGENIEEQYANWKAAVTNSYQSFLGQISGNPTTPAPGENQKTLTEHQMNVLQRSAAKLAALPKVSRNAQLKRFREQLSPEVYNLLVELMKQQVPSKEPNPEAAINYDEMVAP